MSFQYLPLGAVLGGLAGLAGLLYLLQRLRVRHSELSVVTTLFWREAVEEARARVFVRRFRHLPAYLLILAISSLLWLALAGPSAAGRPERQVVFLLDTSAQMARGERFEAAKRVLVSEVEGLPRDCTLVLACGASVQSLLLPGERLALLERRLEELTLEAAPPSIDACLGELATVYSAERPLTAVVLGAAPEPELRALLPAGMEVVVPTLGFEAPTGDGITALGISPSASGDWSTVDALVELCGSADAELVLNLGGEPVAVEAERTRVAGRTRLLFRDLPALGQRLSARLATGDGYPLDDEAAVYLPQRAPIRVALSETVAAVLGPALSADLAVQLFAGGEPDVAVLLAGEETEPLLPALVFVPEEEQESAFLIEHTGGGDSAAVLRELVGALGLDQIDATALATRSGRPITVETRPGQVRRVALWSSLVGEDYDFVQQRAFPLFCAHSLRWLAEVEELRPFAAAGVPLEREPSAFGDSAEHRLDPVGVDFTPPRAGEYLRGDGLAVAASLSELPDAPAESGDDLAAALAKIPAAGPDWARVFGLLALALLVLEWALYRKGRMP